MFLILPITILLVLTVVVTSQLQNIQGAIDQTIFGTIENQSTQLVLQNQPQFGTNTSQQADRSFFNSDNQYTINDVTKIEAIDGVTSASLNTVIPISNIKSTDIFADVTYTISSLSELDSANASLYTEKDFSYTEGQAIPIILNANAFVQSYEDWGDQTSINVTFTRNPGQGPTQAPNTPIKTEAIEYTKEDLVGKEITINFGGLDTINDYTISQSAGTMTFTKLTDEEYASKITARQSAISTYWDYSKLSTPISYKFVVVGVIEDSTSNNSYIPTDFASVLMKTYIQNQLDARNSTEISTSLLNTTYTGITFNGTELTSTASIGGARGGFGFRPAMIFGGRPGESTTVTTSYSIPGLVIDLSDDGSSTVEGEYKDATVYDSAAKKAETITVKLDSVYVRDSVVEALNDAGYAYQDLNNLEVFSNVRSTLNSVSLGLSVSFIAISIGVIIFAMSKFVSESRKEIGIFRAIGMKKSDIVILFTSQAILYTLIAFVVGIGLGISANILAAGFVNSWFTSFVSQTISQTFGVINQVSTSVFNNFDVNPIAIYSGILLVITIVISLIPAFRASSISPVEAINGE